MASTVLARMAVQIAANTSEFGKGIRDANSTLKGFTSNIQNMAATIGVAFGVREVLSFGLEVSKLAGQAVGVKAAFDRLEDSEKLLRRLQVATGNTVSELELMKRAVQASNFDISLKALPRLLEFATLRAQQTGQSVDYLVDSIVTGIGRKSKLILDNLGISAVQLSDELKGVSLDASSIGEVADAVGRIAEKNLKNMAGFSVNAATKIQQLAAEWDNLKVRIGTVTNDTGFFGGVLDVLRYNMIKLSDEWDKFQQSGADPGPFAGLQETLEAFDNWRKLIANTTALGPDLLNMMGDWIKSNKDQIETIGSLEQKIKDLNEDYKLIDISKTNELLKNRQLVDSYQDQIDKIKELIDTKIRMEAARSFKGTFEGAPISILGLAEVEPFKKQEPYEMQFDMDEAVKGLDKYMEKIKEANQKLKDLIESNKQFGIDVAQIAGGALVEFAEGLGRAAYEGKGFGDTILRSVAGFMKQFGQQLVALGIAKLGLDKLFVTGYGAPFAIAAGVALIAAAGALNQSAASSVSSISSGGSIGGFGRSGFSAQTIANTQIEVNVTGTLMGNGTDLLGVIQSTERSNRFRKG